MNKKNVGCECGTLDDLVSDRKCPIEYDKELNEYNLVSTDGRTRYRMYYCFVCGGELPEAKRTDLFAEPSEEETQEVSRLLATVKSFQQAVQVLGQPDETVKAPKASSPERGTSPSYVRHHRYLTRWKTLDLTIREREDGSIDSAYTGKYTGDVARVG